MTSNRIRRAVAVGAIAAAPALLLAPNAMASSVPAHHRHHHHRLTQKQAEAILKFETNGVKHLAQVEQSSKLISSADKASLATATTAEEAALASDLAAVEAGSSTSAYVAAVKSGGLTTAEAGLDFGTVVAADGTEARDASLNKIAAKLEAKAKAAGNRTATADKDAAAAVTVVLALPAAPSGTQLRAAVHTAFEDLSQARKTQAEAASNIARASFTLNPPHHRRRHHHR